MKPGFDPAAPFASGCTPACNSINGQCNPDCTITCSPGFTDCDGNVTNGCECGGTGGGCHSVASCNAGTCMHVSNQPVGTSCQKDCLMNAACDANGECAGQIAADGTVCSSPPPGCSATPECVAGGCTCGGAPLPDFGTGGAGGRGGANGCSLAVHASPYGASILLLLVGMLIFRRRRSN